MHRSLKFAAVTGTFLIASAATLALAGNWGQFRGPNASGRAEREDRLPDEVGPETNVVWKVELPGGHSSPVIFGDRIYLTGKNDDGLRTYCLDRETGKVRWQAPALHKVLEEIHKTASYATPTPATDGKVVVSFFGSCGLFGYDLDGRQLWHIPMGPFKNDFGSGTSPILVEDRVILCQDHDTDSFIMAVDKFTGKVLWKVDRSEFPRNYCTPIIWEVAGKKQVVVAATLRIVGYDFETGKEIWTVRGVARIINMTPVIGDDGTLYAACWSPGGDETDRIITEPFDYVIKQQDANKDGSINLEEAPAGPIKDRFTQVDRDKDGQITRQEYESMRNVFEAARNVMVAVKPGGTGDITDTHVLWRYNKQMPYCPSPVYYRDQIFMIKNGGILAVVDARNGQPLKQGRISATGDYFASPVAGDGKIYTLSYQGKLTVIDAGPGWREISSADFGENAAASPAIADGRLYVRTAGHLYCFGLPGTSP
ncbi:MAG: PQQ-binding-like beta-propeller repeat protein [Planctomycetia bacterium]|nr:PQQ-binding-like beta-propeller repeat protein [Planctomycetia bacterium]